MSEYVPSARTVAVVGSLVHAFPGLLPVLDEHVAANVGEILPHLFMSDLVRWLVANEDARPKLAADVLAWLEEERSRGNADVDNLIDVSFVEMLPLPGETGAGLRSLLGPRMAAEANRLLRGSV